MRCSLKSQKINSASLFLFLFGRDFIYFKYLLNYFAFLFAVVKYMLIFVGQ